MKPGKSQYPSVHRGIVLAALELLKKEAHPAAAFYSSNDAEVLAAEVIKPDQKGDRQRGSGYHYYCAVKPNGKPGALADGDYFHNGRGKKSPSARTMFEEEYAAAVKAQKNGDRVQAMKSLARAAHMLADVCCPPHSCGLTYLSLYARYHKRFETEAARLFWEQQTAPDETLLIRKAAEGVREKVSVSPYAALCREGSGSVLNGLAQRSADVLPAVLGRDKSALLKAVQAQLSLAVGETAALLAAFAEQMTADAAEQPKSAT